MTDDESMQIGEHIKVHLPDENPWAEVLAINGPLVQARIANKLFHEHPLNEQREFTGEHFDTADPLPKMHDHKQGDVLWFERGEFDLWQPVASH